jgi:hypothetical protein
VVVSVDGRSVGGGMGLRGGGGGVGGKLSHGVTFNTTTHTDGGWYFGISVEGDLPKNFLTKDPGRVDV